jgi:UDP-N-acetylglucosamine 2-epimerase (non-hydrolysing)
MRVLTVFGTRPEAIKMAPLVRKLAALPDMESRVCVTAQHRAMLDQVLEAFDIRPEHDLDIMAPGQSLTETCSRVLLGLEPILQEFHPDLVLVHGDTTSAAAATLAAYYQDIPVGHVEAGLRTGDLRAPWPEEGHRRLIASLAAVHFAPTEEARENLIREGIAPAAIHVTGNTVIDALHMVLDRLHNDSRLQESLVRRFSFLRARSRLVLITCHRREVFGAGLERICLAIRELAKRFAEVDFVYPVHPNPEVLGPVSTSLQEIANVHLVEPLDYLPFVHLMQRSCLLLTDSGGIQEEAPALGKPVVVLRDTTERPEALATGMVQLAGTDTAAIVQAAARLLALSPGGRPTTKTPYGDGRASERIVQIVQSLGIRRPRPSP